MLILMLRWYMCFNLLTNYVDSLETAAGVHFEYVFNKDDYFKNEKNIRFTASIDGLPDLPTWMKLNQNSDESDAFLYGTPEVADIGTFNLEVIAWNKETYQTYRHTEPLTVTNQDVIPMQYYFEFKIINKDIDEIFKESGNIFKTVQSFWLNAVYLTLMERPSLRFDGNNPIPGAKEGTYVVIGGTSKPPANLTELSTVCQSIQSKNKIESIMMGAGYKVDWCISKLITGVSSNENGEKDFLKSDQFYSTSMNTDSYSIRGENHILDLVYCFIPIILGISLIVVFTCIMCVESDVVDTVTESSSDERLVPSLVPSDASIQFKVDSLPKSNGENSNFAYGVLDESRSTTPNNQQVQYPKTSSRPPPYKMPPTKLIGMARNNLGNDIADTGI